MTVPAPTKPGFPYKSDPFAPYQRETLKATALKPFHFIAWEQGCGKTWLAINSAAALFLHGKIDGVVVLAPNGVHSAWALEEIPKHMPDVVPWRAHVWRSAKERAKMKQRAEAAPEDREAWAVSDLATNFTGLAILCVNSEAVTLKLAKKAIGTFLARRRCLFIVDESGDFTTPSAKRTRALMHWASRAPYRRCLDGTPVGTEPFELYAPYRFLSPAILGYRKYQDMKDAHAEWETHERGDNGREFKVIAVDRKTGKKKWKDLDVLARKIAPHTSRITKAEALPFLPPKLFKKRFFELTEEQQRLTTELQVELQATLQDGQTVTATNVLTQYLRFQQIACGYVPPDIIYGEEEVQPVSIIPGPNPRLELAIEEALRHDGKPAIIWTRFHFDIDLLAPRLRDEGFTVGVYDGRTTTTQREDVKARFQQGELHFFIGNPAAGGRGLNLYRAGWGMFYANYFGLRRRLQAEDRAHRIGSSLLQNVLWIDLLGLRSIDLTIVRALRNNQEVADCITGDPSKEWI